MSKKPDENDFTGWWCYLHNHRWDLVWKSLNEVPKTKTNPEPELWCFPKAHRHSLQGLFLKYILSRLDHENYLSTEMIEIISLDTGRAMKAGFAPELDDRHRAEYFKRLALIIGDFGELGPRPKDFRRKPKVRQIECLEILMIFLAEKQRPSNKELVERSEKLGFNYTKKDFSEMTEGAGFVCKKEKNGPKACSPKEGR